MRTGGSAAKSLQWSDFRREGHEAYGRMAERRPRASGAYSRMAGSRIGTRHKRKNPSPFPARGFSNFISTSRPYVFNRPGSDLLSRALRQSTIGAEAFNGRVRDGIGFWALRNSHQVGKIHMGEFWRMFFRAENMTCSGVRQSCRVFEPANRYPLRLKTLWFTLCLSRSFRPAPFVSPPARGRTDKTGMD